MDYNYPDAANQNHEPIEENIQTPQPNPQSTPKTPPPNIVNKFSFAQLIIDTEKSLLRIISYFMLFHGLLGIYGELVKLFYIFPHLPEIYQALNYSESIYQTIYRRTVIISATALLETIYGLFLLKNQANLVKRIQLVSSISLLVISFIILKGLPPLDVSNFDMPQPPTIKNLIKDPINAPNLFFPKR